MNPQAKAFEAADLTAYVLRIHEERSHLKNLKEIQNRKNLNIFNSTNGLKRIHLNILSNLQKQRVDNIYFKKLSYIHQKKPKPEINTEFLRKNSQTKICNFLKHKEDNRQIKDENYKMFVRMNKVNPFISSKSNDRKFNKTHTKLLHKLSNVKMRSSVLSFDTNVYAFSPSPKKRLIIRNRSSSDINSQSYTMFNSRYNSVNRNSFIHIDY